MPQISIIVPVYRVEKYLRRCVDSLISQTFTDLEIILVDDGSPDSCGKICDEYAARDHRIVVIHKENGGVSSARNAGLKQAAGAYIGFVDSDDYIDCEMYSKLYQDIRTSCTQIAVCAAHHCYRNTVISDNMQGFTDGVIAQEVALEILLQGKYIYGAVWNKLFSRCLFDNLQFPDCSIAEDLYVTLHTLLQVDRIYLDTAPLYFYLHRGSSAMNTGFHPNFFDELNIYDHIVEALASHSPHISGLAAQRQFEMYLQVLYRYDLASAELRKVFQAEAAHLKRFARSRVPFILQRSASPMRLKIQTILFRVHPRLYTLVRSAYQVRNNTEYKLIE